jgi:hypothetical protein
MFISIEIIYFIVTLICGVLYGMYCYKSGLRAGAENTLDFLEEINYIRIDDEGEVRRVKDREFKK